MGQRSTYDLLMHIWPFGYESQIDSRYVAFLFFEFPMIDQSFVSNFFVVLYALFSDLGLLSSIAIVFALRVELK